MINIYYCDLSKIAFNDNLIKKYNIFLTKEETNRLLNIKIPELKRNFIFGRLIIRQELSKYLNCSNSDITFSKTNLGKLHLSGKFSNSNIGFNISHSKNIIAVIICNNNVGIDVESIKNKDISKISQFSFTKNNIEYLNYLKQNYLKKQYIESFYTYWTLKEAFIKLKGGSILNKNLKLDFDLKNNQKFNNFYNNKSENNFKKSKPYIEIFSTTDIKNNLQFKTFYLQENYILSYAAQVSKDSNLFIHQLYF